jgi:hypothetical protein
MNSRQLVINALEHGDTDGRIPVDIGSTAVTGVHVSVVAQLRDWYGLEKRRVKVHEPYQMLGLIEEDLKQAIGTDVDGVFPARTNFGFPPSDWKEWTTPWGQDVLVPGGFEVTEDRQGNRLIFPQGDRQAPPSAKMPQGGYFFDAITRQPSIDDDALDPSDNLEEFGRFSEEDLLRFEEQVRDGHISNRGVVVNFGGTGFGDIARVPGMGLKHPKGIRDVTEWYISILIRQDYIHEVFQRQVEIALQNLADAFERFEEDPEVVFVCGTDFGTQESLFCSPDVFDSLYKPYYKRINGWIHENTDSRSLKHTDGAIRELIPNLIDAGFDILNPIQVSAKDMSPRELKAEFGKDIVFWGAAVDSQNTLPFGSPKEVHDEVIANCELLAPGGGYVFNTIHNVQAKTPIENVIALIDAVHEFNGVR